MVRGLDVESIRRKAFEKELLKPDSKITDDEIMQLILTPGFSTADKVTQSAGRGVGMDVVANEIKQLGRFVADIVGHRTGNQFHNSSAVHPCYYAGVGCENR